MTQEAFNHGGAKGQAPAVEPAQVGSLFDGEI